MKDTIVIDEQSKAIKITICSETIKEIISVNRAYGVTFDVTVFNKKENVTLDIFNLLMKHYQDLKFLIEI